MAVPWKDIPPTWGSCKPHGWAWYPPEVACVFCEMGGCPEANPKYESVEVED